MQDKSFPFVVSRARAQIEVSGPSVVDCHTIKVPKQFLSKKLDKTIVGYAALDLVITFGVKWIELGKLCNEFHVFEVNCK